ncbi:N-acetylmuramoyl-L-alanine amidase [Gracilimonas sp. BCB1]|uniref:N-acetylmuramoyl-L-alanine amidase n=1 Tax=Gracilimonas sp. BCB1 TaxID=3152362 RepID=UPI0032D8F6CA
MKYFLSLFAFTVLISTAPVKAQTVTGLEGFSIFLDPGHSQTENMGLYNYSEAQKVLRVGLALREMLLTQTDIDTVYISRTNDSQSVDLSQRDDLANATGADFFHSIHSNAGSNTTNNTLFLHGGWRSNGQTVEKTPNGGKEMGDIMEIELTDAMRIPTIGNWADRNFYQGSSVDNHDNQFPYLFVNRTTNMASVLSEAGFHTNPTQQKRNLNADWKRLEAQSFFWSILEYLDVERPPVGIATGYITNADGGLPINGAEISIGDSTYTTDTFESLFNNYAANPGDLQNGFYYMEGLENGPAQIIVEAEGFYTDTVDTNIISTDFTFTDVAMVSNIPPNVASTSIGEDGEINPGETLVLNFSRSMDRTAVENALTLAPEADYTLTWNSDKKLSISTNSFDFESSYTLKIDSTATDNSSYAHTLDGDADGTQGDSYSVTFETGPVDIIPPAISDIRPTNTQFNELRPIISATFDEHLDTTLFDEATVEVSKSDYVVPGETVYYTIGDRSVLNFFPSERLDKSRNYTFTFSKSISDTAGNSLGSDIVRTFPTGDQDIADETSVDDFEDGISAWWEPSQSGSTDGYIAEETSVEISTAEVNLLTNSSQSMRVNYGWDTTSTSNLIRQYRGGTTTPKFANDLILQTYVFGDGNGNKFRFMLRDGNGELEGSSWYTVDWLGWKLVSWDLSQDSVVAWVNGNGTLNGNLYLDSFQMTYTEGQPTTGFIVFDDLRAVEMGLATSTEPNDELISDVPNQIELKQNYPNPFNPSTNISFGLPQQSEVDLKIYDMLGREVATVYSGVKSKGFHTIQFDASRLSSGVYIYRLVTKSGTVSKKMTLLK